MGLSKMSLTIFYDACCPLCVAEMKKLARLDKNQNLSLINIHSPSDMANYPNVDVTLANQYLHAINHKGQMLFGLDVTLAAWQIVDKGWLVHPLKWRWLRFFADPFYMWFAKHRFTLSRILTGKRRCEACEIIPQPKRDTTQGADL